MSATTSAASQSGFVSWIMANGQLIAFFAQLVYWLVIAVCVVYAVAQLKRWVNYQLGTGHSGKLRTGAADEKAADANAVSIEEFVE